jgi:hypothetical protein
LGGDVVSVCRQPIELLFSLFARTNSPGGKRAKLRQALEKALEETVEDFAKGFQHDIYNIRSI